MTAPAPRVHGVVTRSDVAAVVVACLEKYLPKILDALGGWAMPVVLPRLSDRPRDGEDTPWVAVGVAGESGQLTAGTENLIGSWRVVVRVGVRADQILTTRPDLDDWEATAITVGDYLGAIERALAQRPFLDGFATGLSSTDSSFPSVNGAERTYAEGLFSATFRVPVPIVLPAALRPGSDPGPLVVGDVVSTATRMP